MTTALGASLTLLLALLVPSCATTTPAPRPPERLETKAVATPEPSAMAAVEPVAIEPPTVAPHVEPPYELATDLDRLREKARRELGDKVAFALSSDVYLVVAAPSWGRSGAAEGSKFIERVLGALHHERFTKRLTHAMPVYLFGDATSYHAYCRARWGAECISPYGFFSPSDHQLVMNVGLGIGTLSHELVHPILAEDFPDAPTWLNEGIASLFEAPIMPRAGEIHGAKNWRHPRLAAALASPGERTVATLPSLFALASDENFRGHSEDLHYAMARYTCQWLDAQGLLWPFYHAWRDGFADDKTGEKAFKKIVGQTPADASATWERWARGL